MIKIAPSILSADFARMGEDVAKLKDWGADWVHFDVMDGHFVPNLTFGPSMCKAVRPYTDLPLDVHLMVERPGEWIEAFASSGADLITFHIESEEQDPAGLLRRIHEAGCRAGLVLRPATPVETVEAFLEECDLVLLMSVNPGFGGQAFIRGTLDKIRELRRMIDMRGLSIEIEIDGGVNPDTAKECIEAGATVLVAGSAVFRAEDPKHMISLIRNEK